MPKWQARKLREHFPKMLKLREYRCEVVPIGYNKDKSGIPVFSRGCGFLLVLFPLKNTPKMGVGRGGDKRSFHIKDKFLEIVRRLKIGAWNITMR